MKITHLITAFSLSLTAALASFTEPKDFSIPSGIPHGFTMNEGKISEFFAAIGAHTKSASPDIQKIFGPLPDLITSLDTPNPAQTARDMQKFAAFRLAGELWFEGDMVEGYVSPILKRTPEARASVRDIAHKTGFLQILNERAAYETYAHVPAVLADKTTLVLAAGDLMLPHVHENRAWSALTDYAAFPSGLPIPSSGFTRQWDPKTCVTICNAPSFGPGIVADIHNAGFYSTIPNGSLMSIVLEPYTPFLGISQVSSKEKDPKTGYFIPSWKVDEKNPEFQAYAAKLKSGGTIQVTDAELVDRAPVDKLVVVYTKP